MFVGEVVAVHLPAADRRPLVKHGPMHSLGEPVRRTAVVATAQLLDAGTLRVAATGPEAQGADVWRVHLLHTDGTRVDLGEHPSHEYGDFLVDLPLPEDLGSAADARPGFARLLGAVAPS
jgi:hypothetical protein